MWLTKKFVMEDFAAEVKKGNYKKIDYQIWRDLKELPDEWDLNVQMYTNSYLETNPTFSIISWDGCDWPYELPADDGSLGEYIRTLVEIYNTPSLNLNTSAFSNAINKVSEAAVKAGAAITTAAQASNWTTSSSNDWKYISGDWNDISVGSNFYEKQPAVEISEKGLKINGQSLNKVIDEALCNSINRKEKNNMNNLFKGFDFGSCENDNVKMSIYGVAVKNSNGTWVSYDSKSGNVIDVDILNFSAKYLYKMPVAIKDVASGDVIIHNRKPMFVTDISDGKLLVIDPAAGEEKIVLLTKNMFGFDFATKVVNLFGNLSASASADSPFGNMLPLMMLADDDKSSDMLSLMLLMNGASFDISNPMMLYFLTKDNKANDILPLMFFANGQGIAFGKSEAEARNALAANA